MKVAIIGAGLSGLACARELIKNGITPVIFEKNNTIGERYELPALVFRVFNSPVKDPLKYLNKNFGLKLIPHYILKEAVMIGPHRTTVARGTLGYIFRRGKFNGSMHHQIFDTLNVPIEFNTFMDFNNIKNDYDSIVISTGMLNQAAELGLFTETFYSTVRVAKVAGNFPTNSIKIWFNTEYAKNSYIYLVPDTEKTALLVLVVDYVSSREIDYYWYKFLESENSGFQILETKDSVHQAGFVSPLQVDNIYFTGYAAGLVDDLVGFGSLKSVMSGAIAAQSIIKGKNYNDIMQPFLDDLFKKHEFRKAANTFDNKGYDRLLAFLGLPLINPLIYKNPLFKVTQATPLARLYNYMFNRGKG